MADDWRWCIDENEVSLRRRTALSLKRLMPDDIKGRNAPVASEGVALGAAGSYCNRDVTI